MELGSCSSGERLEFSADDDTNADIRLYRFDYSVLADIYDKMSSRVLEVSAYGDDFIKGSIDVDARSLGYGNDKALMLVSTPYDEGWSVKLDGEPVELYKGLDTFVSFYVGSGHHTVEMSYEPRGLRLGTYITLISLAILALSGIVTFIGRRRHKAAMLRINNNDQKHEETDT